MFHDERGGETVLIVTDRGQVRTGEHLIGAGEIIEHDGRLAQVDGDLADELLAALATGAGALADVEHGGPACTPSIRDGVLLRWVLERAVVTHLDGDPGPAVPVPPAEPGAVY